MDSSIEYSMYPIETPMAVFGIPETNGRFANSEYRE
jgi:hypothetical protein